MTRLESLRLVHLDWKFWLALGVACVASSGVTSVGLLWRRAGPPTEILVEQSTMHVVKAGHILQIAVLRNLRRTDCVTTTARWVSRPIKFKLTPEMRAAAPDMPAVVDTQEVFFLNSTAVPQLRQGRNLSVFDLVLPADMDPAQWHYGGAIKAACPLIPMRTTVTNTAAMGEFTVLPPDAPPASSP